MQNMHCKDIAATKKVIEKLDMRKDEWEEKLGYEIDEDELTLVIWQVMDDKTHDLCIANSMEQYTTPYEHITKFILAKINNSIKK